MALPFYGIKIFKTKHFNTNDVTITYVHLMYVATLTKTKYIDRHHSILLSIT